MAHLVLWWDTYHFFLASKDSGCEKRQPVRANAVTWLFMGIHFHRLERINSEKVCKRLITYYIVSGIFSISILYFQFVDQTTLQFRKTKNHRFVAISTRLLDLQRASAALALWSLKCVAVSVWWRAGHRRWRLSFMEFDGKRLGYLETAAPGYLGDHAQYIPRCFWCFSFECEVAISLCTSDSMCWMSPFSFFSFREIVSGLSWGWNIASALQSNQHFFQFQWWWSWNAAVSSKNR